MNSFTIVGRLVADPEHFATLADKAGCKFSVAERASKERTNYFDVVCYSNMAEVIADLGVKKGDKLTICGSIVHNKWTDNKGNKRQGYNFVAHSIDLTRKIENITDTTPVDIPDEAMPF